MPTITPCLWFDNTTVEAVHLYTSIFEKSKITTMNQIPVGPAKGNAITTFQLCGRPFMAFDGGPHFRFTPAISLFVTCESHDQLRGLWGALSQGGTALMPLESYPFSELFGWLNDRFGLSWQLNLAGGRQAVAPALLFVGDKHGRAEEALHFYTSLLPNSKIDHMERYGPGEDEPESTVKHARFLLDGQEFVAMESALAHEFTFTPAISLSVTCRGQQEIDDLWEKLAEGGAIQQCGWVQDKFGISWQVVPEILDKMVSSGEPEKWGRALNALFEMKKIDVKVLEEA